MSNYDRTTLHAATLALDAIAEGMTGEARGAVMEARMILACGPTNGIVRDAIEAARQHATARVPPDAIRAFAAWWEDNASKDPSDDVGAFAADLLAELRDLADTGGREWLKRRPVPCPDCEGER